MAEFTKNLFVMLVAIMVGVIVVTYFVADIIRRTEIETLTTEHIMEIEDINSKYENFTDYFLQGTIKMDGGREIREEANLYFDFALFWYNNALVNANVWYNNVWINGTNETVQDCIENCTLAMDDYLASHEKFNESKPFFITAMTFTERAKYVEVLGYYVSFAKLGKDITMLRYNSTKYLKFAAENISIGDFENATLLMGNFTIIEEMYQQMLADYEDQQGQIDEYLFFDEIREEH